MVNKVRTLVSSQCIAICCLMIPTMFAEKVVEPNEDPSSASDWTNCVGQVPRAEDVSHPIGYTFPASNLINSSQSGGHITVALTRVPKSAGQLCQLGDLVSDTIVVKPDCVNNVSSVLLPWNDLVTSLNQSLPAGQYFLCSKQRSKNEAYEDWRHLGAQAIAKPLVKDYPLQETTTISNILRARSADSTPLYQLVPLIVREKFFARQRASKGPIVAGLRVESGGGKSPYVNDEGVLTIAANEGAVLRLFGINLTAGMQFKFAFALESEFNEAVCDQTSSTRVFMTEEPPVPDGLSVLLPVNLPDMPNPAADYYPCLRVETPGGVATWQPVGWSPAVQVRADSKLLPVWVQIVFISVLLCLSGLFSGLNLGLMSLDRTELKILRNTGSDKEKRYAAKVMPVRRLGNYLLCSLLLGNVLVNSSLTLLLDELTSGLIAIIGSTLGIVIFGEIIPQAICSRHGLAVGAYTVWITKIFMALTFPLAYPISKILDKILGKEIGSHYDRERLKELVKVTNEYNDLERDEVNIISGALDMKKKRVSEVMTKLDDVFMLSYDAVLDFATMADIRRNGYSRIPVYDGERSNIVSILYVKDLVLMDPDDDTPLKTLCDFYKNPCFFVYDDTSLDVIFRLFKSGDKGHLAFIQKIVDSTDKDPEYEVIGIVTLEDVIEEMIQAEIVDETDIFTDNHSKRRLRRNEERQTKHIFVPMRRGLRSAIMSPQLALAALQYLSTSVEAFKPDHISERILRQLLKQDIFFQIKVPKNNKKHQENSNELYVYQRGKPEDYFVLILEGRAEVIVGNENLTFEAGPFTSFGMKALGSFETDNEESTSGSKDDNIVSIPTNEGERRLRPKLPIALARIGSYRRMAKINAVDSSPAAGTKDDGVKTPTNIPAPLPSNFVPDYSVKAVTDLSYVKIRSVQYAAARRATLLFHRQTQEHSAKSMNQLDRDVEKIWRDVEKLTRRSFPRNDSALSFMSATFEAATSTKSKQHLLTAAVSASLENNIHQAPHHEPGAAPSFSQQSSSTLDDNNSYDDDDDGDGDQDEEFVMEEGQEEEEEEEIRDDAPPVVVEDADGGASLSTPDVSRSPVVEDLENEQQLEESNRGTVDRAAVNTKEAPFRGDNKMTNERKSAACSERTLK